jgi:ABC-type multidrug transport system fused ATPase/permease subunit
VLILDEPTSALDPHSEAIIQRSLATLKRELTVFVVAHRMSTVDICDRLMVIVGGRLEAFAPTAALLESSAYYRSVAAAVGHGSTAPMSSS